MEIVIITGPPYSGKGTQCNILKDTLEYEHISTGDRCRLEQERKSDIGKILASGNLVPDEIMKELFSQILDENLSKKGIILDGYPRTIPQVDDLLELVRTKGLVIGHALNLEVPKAELLIRAKERAKNSEREDDRNPATHLKRVAVFEETTKPAIAYMKSKFDVYSFSGIGSIQEVTTRIAAGLRNKKLD